MKVLDKSPFRERHGPMTRELLLQPGNFGLGKVPSGAKPASVCKSICGFCATGCGLKIHLDAEGQAINVTPDPDYPVNSGMACPKGWEALTPLAATDRATTPILDGLPIDWPTALDAFCTNFKAIQQRHGPESIAFLSTGQIMVEEMAFLGALAKFGMGMIHGDGNTRQCMATAATAYKQAFGFDAPPFTYADLEESDVLVFVGANPAIAHPIMWQRVERNPHSPKIIVIDPRATETAMAATQHLAIQPKTDIILLYCIAHELLRKGRIDREFVANHTNHFEDFAKFLEPYDPNTYLPTIGLKRIDFDRCVEAIAQGKRVSMWWTMGINQGHQATRTAQAIINLCLMTGNIGRPGTGPNSITGQCNAMGSRLFSNTTNLLGGHDFTNPEHRLKVAKSLDIPFDRIPSENSLAYDQIIEGIHQGKIKGLWMLATNAAHSWIQQDTFTEAVKKLEFFVVQDMYATTQTARLANLVLPAGGWGEKEGTFINAERRLGVSRKVSRAPGEALADFSIFRLIADAWGCADLFKRWTSPEAVFKLLQGVSADQPCDISGILGYGMLESLGGIQWPFTASNTIERSERRLFADGLFFTPDQKARFLFEAPVALPEPTDSSFRFTLLTGRGSSAQWHTETRTGKSAILRKLHSPKLLVDLHPDDAKPLGINSGCRVQVRTRRGQLFAYARITTTIQPGQLFLPMHHQEVNRLTMAVFDPHSRQPSYKACAAAVAPA
jgi:anaerobic selenocysteine-containing dehydrogenase